MSDQRHKDAAGGWRIWLNEIRAPQLNPARALAAAKQVAAENLSRGQLRQWLAAIAGTVDDPLTCDEAQAQLPDFVVAQQARSFDTGEDNARFADLRAHLALCPYCIEAYATTAEWLTAAVADNVPVSQSYPVFDLAFLTTSPPVASPPNPSSLLEAIQDAVAAGRRWLENRALGLLLLFGPGLQSQPAVAWAVKSAQAGALLAQMVLTEAETGGWEITVAAFAQEPRSTSSGEEGSQEFCQVEVALYRPDAELEGIAITLLIGAEARHAHSDSGGVAIFYDVPLARIPEVLVQVGVGGESFSGSL